MPRATCSEAAFPEDVTSDRDSYTRDDWAVLARCGLLGASIAARFGGRGYSADATATVFETAGEVCHDIGMLFAAAAHLFACAMPIAEFANSPEHERWLAAMCAGEAIAGNAITEEGAGSDTSRLATRGGLGGSRINAANTRRGRPIRGRRGRQSRANSRPSGRRSDRAGLTTRLTIARHPRAGRHRRFRSLTHFWNPAGRRSGRQIGFCFPGSRLCRC
jgi:Acyl-CoA dehydrogenase, N-terminal domain